MIRFRSGQIPTPQELRDGLKGRVAITDFPRRRERGARVPSTAILCCPVCERAFPLRAHCPYTCARQHGLRGDAVATRARALRGVA